MKHPKASCRCVFWINSPWIWEWKDLRCSSPSLCLDPNYWRRIWKKKLKFDKSQTIRKSVTYLDSIKINHLYIQVNTIVPSVLSKWFGSVPNGGILAIIDFLGRKNSASLTAMVVVVVDGFENFKHPFWKKWSQFISTINLTISQKSARVWLTRSYRSYRVPHFDPQPLMNSWRNSLPHHNHQRFNKA